MQFICDILTVLLGYIEIDKFKVINIKYKIVGKRNQLLQIS